jgi:hypothetical protein
MKRTKSFLKYIIKGRGICSEDLLCGDCPILKPCNTAYEEYNKTEHSQETTDVFIEKKYRLAVALYVERYGKEDVVEILL